MKVVFGVPPNIAQIQQHLKPTATACFCYGDTIYNAGVFDIPEDVMEHEEVHMRQQLAIHPQLGPKLWWDKVLADPVFRLAQELEAYAVQYQWIKERVTADFAKQCLFGMASDLSVMYSLNITVGQAESKIRNAAKRLQKA